MYVASSSKDFFIHEIKKWNTLNFPDLSNSVPHRERSSQVAKKDFRRVVKTVTIVKDKKKAKMHSIMVDIKSPTLPLSKLTLTCEERASP